MRAVAAVCRNDAFLTARAFHITSTRHDRYAPIYFTGHSLGGALAMLAAYDVTINFERLPHPVQVRGWTQAWCDWMDGRAFEKTRHDARRMIGSVYHTTI